MNLLSEDFDLYFFKIGEAYKVKLINSASSSLAATDLSFDNAEYISARVDVANRSLDIEDVQGTPDLYEVGGKLFQSVFAQDIYNEFFLKIYNHDFVRIKLHLAKCHTY